MATLNAKPKKEETIVRMPEKNYQALPVEGAEVPDNSYWRRRLNDGDIVLVKSSRKKSSSTHTEK